MKGWMAVVGAAILVVGLALGFGVKALADGDSSDGGDGGDRRTITVSATATAEQAPDQATIDIGTNAESEESGDALQEGAQQMQSVIDAVKGAGVDEADIETTNVGVRQRTLDRGTSNERQVFVATNSIQVTVKDLDSVGTVIDTAVDAGASRVGRIRFGISDPDRVQADALEQAVQSARSKADALAAAAGAQVVGVVSVDEEQRGYPGVGRMSAALAYDEALAAESPVLPPETLEAEVAVLVVWEIA